MFFSGALNKKQRKKKELDSKTLTIKMCQQFFRNFVVAALHVSHLSPFLQTNYLGVLFVQTLCFIFVSLPARHVACLR